MAGRLLTEDDFREGGEPKGDDTPKPPPKDEKPIEKEKVEPEPKEPPVERADEPEPKPEKKYKYKDMDEYDRAYKEAERKMHEATMKAAEKERELEQYKRPAPKVETVEDRIRDMSKQTLARIKALPADSPNRDEEATLLWTRHSDEVAQLRIEERERRAEEISRQSRHFYSRASEEGFKNEEEMDLLGVQFSRTDPTLPLDDRIAEAITTTKQKLSKLREGFVEKEERDEKDNLRVLGKGSSPRRRESREVEEKPVTMSQQMAEVNEKRRMKKEDLR